MHAYELVIGNLDLWVVCLARVNVGKELELTNSKLPWKQNVRGFLTLHVKTFLSLPIF